MNNRKVFFFIFRVSTSNLNLYRYTIEIDFKTLQIIYVLYWSNNISDIIISLIEGIFRLLIF